MSTGLVRNGDRRARGSALIVALAIVLLLASISTVLVMEMTTRAHRVEVDLEDIKAFEAAEAGVDAALHDINSSPVYQPSMSPPAMIYPLGLSGPGPNATRVSSGELQPNGQLGTSTGGILLIGPDSGKPLTVHVAKRADGTRPGCIGTSNWTAANDLDSNGRPSWRPLQMRDASGYPLNYTSGPLAGSPRYCEDNIMPQALGNVAFFTYAIDWFHDGTDNDGDGTIDDRNERNKYTIYSTGIHRGIRQSGVTEAGRVVTIEVMVQALDKDSDVGDSGPLDLQFKRRN